MKSKLKVIGLCFLMFLSLIGCQNKEKKKEEVAMGRFIEQAIKIEGIGEEDNIFMTQTKAGKVQVFDQGESGDFVVYEESEEGTFKKVKPEWLDEVNKYACEKWVAAFSLDENDKPCMVVIGQIEGADSENYSPDFTRTTIYYFDQDEMKSCQLKIEGGLPYIIPDKIALLKGEKVILSGQNQVVCAYDLKTGEFINNYTSTPGSFFVRDDQLFALDLEENKIMIFGADNNKVIKEIACEAASYSSMIAPGEEESIYLVTESGIRKYKMDDTVPMLIMDSNGTSLKLPSHCTEKAAVENGRVIVMQLDDQGRHLFRTYSYSATTPTLPTAELNAYALKENNTFMEFISDYQLAHPEIRINMQVGMTEDNGMTRKDALAALNTEILAGGGPDIILLDDLKADTYIDKMLLMDLNEINKEELFPFVLTPYTRDGHMYGMPLRFEVPVILGDQAFLENIHTIDELYDYMTQHQEEKVVSPDLTEIEANRIAASYEDKWFNSEGVDQKELTHFLEVVNTLLNRDYLLEEEEFGEGTPTSIVSGGLCDMVFNDYKAYQGDISAIDHLLCANAANEKKGNCDINILQVEGKTYCKARCSVAINNSSKNKETALEILKSMLTKENQVIDTRDGFPVNKAAFDCWMSGESVNKNMYYSFGNRGENGESQIIEYSWGNEEAINAFKDKVYQIEDAKIVDSELLDMVIKEAMPYFKGQNTVDEVVSQISKKYEIYMQEQ